MVSGRSQGAWISAPAASARATARLSQMNGAIPPPWVDVWLGVDVLLGDLDQDVTHVGQLGPGHGADLDELVEQCLPLPIRTVCAQADGVRPLPGSLDLGPGGLGPSHRKVVADERGDHTAKKGERLRIDLETLGGGIEEPGLAEQEGVSVLTRDLAQGAGQAGPDARLLAAHGRLELVEVGAHVLVDAHGRVRAVLFLRG